MNQLLKLSSISVLFIVYFMTSCDKLIDSSLNNTDCTDFTGELYMSADPVMFTDTFIAANLLGGQEPFTYEWNDGSTADIFPVVEQGLCNVTITDANGCVLMLSAAQWTCDYFEVDIQLESNNNMDQILIAHSIGSVAPFTYEWSNGQTTKSINIGQQSGTYSVTVTDANTCVYVSDIQI